MLITAAAFSSTSNLSTTNLTPQVLPRLPRLDQSSSSHVQVQTVKQEQKTNEKRRDPSRRQITNMYRTHFPAQNTHGALDIRYTENTVLMRCR